MAATAPKCQCLWQKHVHFLPTLCVCCGSVGALLLSSSSLLWDLLLQCSLPLGVSLTTSAHSSWPESVTWPYGVPQCVWGGGEPPYRRWSGVGKEWHSVWWFPTETNTIFVRTVLWHELILTPASRCENWYEKLRDMSTALKGASLDTLFLEIISQNP